MQNKYLRMKPVVAGAITVIQILMVIILHLISTFLQHTACALYVHHIGDKVIGTLITQDTGMVQSLKIMLNQEILS